jgi:hypothetical protein
MPGGDGGGK